MNQNRVTYIDFAKGFAIYLVVLGHIIDRVEFSHIYSIIASFHMPLFFFLSGIAMQYTKCGNYKYVFRKIVNLLCPFITVTALWGGGMISSYWYLPILFSYSITVFINKILWNKSKVICVVFDVLLAFFVSFVLYRWHSIRFVYSMAFYFAAYLIPFLCGVFYNLYKGSMPKIVYFFCLCIVFLVIPFFNGFVHHSVYMHILKNIIGISMSLLLLELFQHIDYEYKITKFVCFVGKNSLSVYLFHFYMLGVYIQYGEIVDLLPNMAIAMFVVLISIVIGKLISLSKIMSFVVLGQIPDAVKKYFY